MNTIECSHELRLYGRSRAALGTYSSAANLLTSVVDRTVTFGPALAGPSRQHAIYKNRLHLGYTAAAGRAPLSVPVDGALTTREIYGLMGRWEQGKLVLPDCPVVR